MHCYYDEIDLLFISQIGCPLSGFADRVAQLNFREVLLRIIEARHPRGCKSDYPNSNPGQLFYQKWLKIVFVSTFLIGVCGKPWKTGLAPSFIKCMQPKFIFVISYRHCIVSDCAHDLHHWIRCLVVYLRVIKGE